MPGEIRVKVYDRDEPDYGEFRGLVELPCGASGWLDGTGYRCTSCFTIYGSIVCPCTRQETKK